MAIEITPELIAASEAATRAHRSMANFDSPQHTTYLLAIEAAADAAELVCNGGAYELLVEAQNAEAAAHAEWYASHNRRAA